MLITDEDREWIDTRADQLFRESERQRGGIRPNTVMPQDYRDYFVVQAAWERAADALIEAERRGAERMRERAAAIADQFDAKRFYETYRAEYNRKRYDVAGVERMQRKALNIQAENARDAIRALPLTEETCDADA